MTTAAKFGTVGPIASVPVFTERPEQRNFKIPDLQAYLLDHRSELIASALIILRAYHLAGRPEQKLPRWGGFDQWCSFIRDPLVWVGMTDPCLTRESVLADDPDKENAAIAFAQLRENFPGNFTVKDATEKANDITGKTYSYPGLHDALSAVTGGNNSIPPRTLGYWLRAWRNRCVGDLRLVRTRPQGGHDKVAMWRIQSLQP